ncbi:hypothetical protein [Streptomyces clavuligerus]|uniref:hypothetical protein n=1 Tax=Streptomyces clavuligerus TaxID=1901 RepID=UPI0001800978|nr:hypothetical protein [Streptomyces clavuligerus]ANW22608.1 hypothetical protein BB341_30345 [Streptomyces clavuligerus]AXU16923.1 hypothetical protein D1794_29665 [Streptomyces clavuligerus]EDY53363.1 hypothetical protein SSCG_06391 [Streptomyces clavuligerus]MBY6306812.1 hypothetical protein [Streptomyces clavuligerus]QCS10588.1 hypothetical protein CRV15_34220 [Streptomyces clavuligerus]
MRARVWIAGLWAVSCLGGLAAIAVLDPGPTAGERRWEPAVGPTAGPTADPAVDPALVVECEQFTTGHGLGERATAPPVTEEGPLVILATAVPEECADTVDGDPGGR